MRLKNISFNSPQENILFDDVLLALAEQGKGGEILRFWESSQPFIVLGRTGKVREEIKLDAVKEDSIPVLRRSSGGGTVLQGAGCLNYSLILSKENDPALADLRRSYQVILGKVIAGMRDLGIEAVFRPISDIALLAGERKFSGNAQRRARKYILHHGTVLYDFNLSLIRKYLKMPGDIPDYRQGREHHDFVVNISSAPEMIMCMLREQFIIDAVDNDLCEAEEECLDRFLSTKSVFVDI